MATWESNGHVTVTLSDPERSKGRDPNTLRGQYLENVCTPDSSLAYNGDTIRRENACPQWNYLLITWCLFLKVITYMYRICTHVCLRISSNSVMGFGCAEWICQNFQIFRFLGPKSYCLWTDQGEVSQKFLNSTRISQPCCPWGLKTQKTPSWVNYSSILCFMQASQ